MGAIASKTQRRAFSEDQKQQRREAILEAAQGLFDRHRYDEVTMAAVARRAGLGKGTVFFYFGTKEALFLAVARQEIEAFFDRMDADLRRRRAPGGTTRVVRGLGEAIAAHPRMVRLLSLLHVVLETNVTFEVALEFRRTLIPWFARAGRQWERHLPFLLTGEGARLLLRVHAMALGFLQLADPAPVMRRVAAQPGMELYDVDFVSTLLDTVRLVLLGMETQAKGTA